jgi:hypothetical protein
LKVYDHGFKVNRRGIAGKGFRKIVIASEEVYSDDGVVKGVQLMMTSINRQAYKKGCGWEVFMVAKIPEMSFSMAGYKQKASPG